MSFVGEVSLSSLKKEVVKKHNIGYLVEIYARKFNTFHCNLVISNDVLVGSFIIPLALGYSTPLASLGDISKAELVFTTKRMIGANGFDSESLFRGWKQIYQVGVVKKRKNRTVTNSSDNVTCAMCLDEYEVGDKLYEFSCKHRIHNKCYPKNKKMNCPHCREEEESE